MYVSIFGLVLFHFVFFRKFYFQNPYVYATSEPLDTAFPSSHVLGKALRRAQLVEDDCYYPRYRSLPFLSAWYLPHCLQAYIGTFLPINGAWILYNLTMLLHFLFASIGAFMLFQHFAPAVRFFGAITFAHMGYAIKQNSSIIYTLAWVPWVFYGADIHSPLITGASLGMMTLAGYWPVALYLWPLSGCYWVTRL